MYTAYAFLFFILKFWSNILREKLTKMNIETQIYELNFPFCNTVFCKSFQIIKKKKILMFNILFKVMIKKSK